MKFEKYKSGIKGLSKYYLGIDKPVDELVSKRRQICTACPKLTELQNKSGTFKKVCAECGCFIIPKTKIKSEKCPIGKW